MENVTWRDLPWYSKALYWATYQLTRLVPSYGTALRKALRAEANLRVIHALSNEELDALRRVKVTFPKGPEGFEIENI